MAMVTTSTILPMHTTTTAGSSTLQPVETDIFQAIAGLLQATTTLPMHGIFSSRDTQGDIMS